MATGVLPVCIGCATRIMEYLDLDFKTYKCTMKLGMTTDTDDIWGTMLSERPVSVSEKEIRQAFRRCNGVIMQIPPKYSALKVNGRRLYDYARKDIHVDINPRKINIKEIQIDRIEKEEIEFTVTCSKGTYIRSICRDIGDELGCGGCMSALERIKSGEFIMRDSFTIDELEGMSREDVVSILLPVDYPLKKLGKATVYPKRAGWFLNGGALSENDVTVEIPAIAEGCPFKESGFEKGSKLLHAYRIFDGEKFLGVAVHIDGKYKVDKIFAMRNEHEGI